MGPCASPTNMELASSYLIANKRASTTYSKPAMTGFFASFPPSRSPKDCKPLYSNGVRGQPHKSQAPMLFRYANKWAQTGVIFPRRKPGWSPAVGPTGTELSRLSTLPRNHWRVNCYAWHSHNFLSVRKVSSVHSSYSLLRLIILTRITIKSVPSKTCVCNDLCAFSKECPQTKWTLSTHRRFFFWAVVWQRPERVYLSLAAR